MIVLLLISVLGALAELPPKDVHLENLSITYSPSEDTLVFQTNVHPLEAVGLAEIVSVT